MKRDPGCKAKQAIARALVTLECQDLEFYRAGLALSAARAGMGPAHRHGHRRALQLRHGTGGRRAPRAPSRNSPRLLTDPESAVRSGAARAISCGNPQEAEAVLRFKVQIGDAEPEVIGECFSALLIIEPEHSLPFVAAYLRHEDEALREFAALALGESRLPQALALLREAWDDAVGSGTRGALIRAAALHRSEPAFDWLLDIIATGSAGACAGGGGGPVRLRTQYPAHRADPGRTGTPPGLTSAHDDRRPHLPGPPRPESGQCRGHDAGKHRSCR